MPTYKAAKLRESRDIFRSVHKKRDVVSSRRSADQASSSSTLTSGREPTCIARAWESAAGVQQRRRCPGLSLGRFFCKIHGRDDYFPGGLQRGIGEGQAERVRGR